MSDMAEQYYLQDSRSYVGNNVLWWAAAGGYTTDLSKANIFTKIDAVSQHNERETDIPWPKDYIDGKSRPAVDMQYINRNDALAGTGIVIRKPAKPHKDTYRCSGCGRLMSLSQFWGGECANCGLDNR